MSDPGKLHLPKGARFGTIIDDKNPEKNVVYQKGFTKNKDVPLNVEHEGLEINYSDEPLGNDTIATEIELR